MGLWAWTGDTQSTPQMAMKCLSFKLPVLKKIIPSTKDEPCFTAGRLH